MELFFTSPLGKFALAATALFVYLIVLGILNKQKKFSVTTLTYMSLAIALAVASSFFKIPMPYGGSISICRMFFICIIGFWFGPVSGMLAGVTYGLIDFILDPVFRTPVQAILDYPLAFGMLGLAGLLKDTKHGLYTGFALGVLGRFVCSVISGVVFFYEYAPVGDNVIIYSMVYNATYMVPEFIISCIIISLPAFKKVILNMKTYKYS